MLPMISLFFLCTIVTSLELTSKNWDDAMDNKAVFIKFYAPWCGHCKAMKTDWDKLMKEYANHEYIVVADVDCIGNGKEICTQQGIEGFPTIKHGASFDLEDYQGGRDYTSLKAFTSRMKKPCTPANLKSCDADIAEKMETWLAMSIAELEALIKADDEKLAAVDNAFTSGLEELQSTYEKNREEHDQEVAKIQHGTLKYLKMVRYHKFGPKPEPWDFWGLYNDAIFYIEDVLYDIEEYFWVAYDYCSYYFNTAYNYVLGDDEEKSEL